MGGELEMLVKGTGSRCVLVEHVKDSFIILAIIGTEKLIVTKLSTGRNDGQTEN